MSTQARNIVVFILISLMPAGASMAQRISFGLWAEDGISLTPGSVDGLNFNDKKQAIVPGCTVTIILTDDEAAVLTIEAREDLDVTVSIDAPATLDMDEDNQIPLALGFAYSNQGTDNEADAKVQAVQVPAGFTSVTFPMIRRAGGPPGPPPTPDHEGITLPAKKAYLFIYGVLGPVPDHAAAGQYTGQINVRVEYSTYLTSE